MPLLLKHQDIAREMRKRRFADANFQFIDDFRGLCSFG
jgi:hypothetical protein